MSNVVVLSHMGSFGAVLPFLVILCSAKSAIIGYTAAAAFAGETSSIEEEKNCLFQVCVLRSQNPTSEAAPQLQPTQQIRQQCSPAPLQENLFTIVVLGRHQQQHQEQQLHRLHGFQQLFLVGRCDSGSCLRRTTAAALLGVQLLVQRPSPQGLLQPVGIVVKPVIRIWYDLWLMHTQKNSIEAIL